MPIRLIFRCDFCDLAPDHATQLTLEHQLRELAFGEYRAIRHGALSAMPKWGLP
jgi:hypothetical protein